MTSVRTISSQKAKKEPCKKSINSAKSYFYRSKGDKRSKSGKHSHRSDEGGSNKIDDSVNHKLIRGKIK